MEKPRNGGFHKSGVYRRDQHTVSKSMHGKHNHSIDDKGRLIIPAKFREALGRDIIMSPALEDNCIYVYSEEEWDNLTEQLSHLTNSKEQNRELKRYFQANAVDCSIDSQGRTIVPAELRKNAGIDKDVVVVGNGKKAEIWSAEVWREREERPVLSRQAIRQMLENSDIEIFG